MAVQQRRKTRSKRDMRRSNNSKFSGPALSVDPMTGETHLRHHVTKEGYYKGKKVVASKEKIAVDEEE